MEVVLRFAHNNSIYLERVLAIAGPATVTRRDDPSGTYYRLVFSRERLSDLFAALEYAKNWDSTTIEVDGQILSAKQLREVVACHRACLKAEDPRTFCRGPWEGRLFPCRAIRIDESEERGWFRFGRLEGDVFVVDKEKMARAIRSQLAEGHHDLCPLLRRDEIEAVLSELPATIDPRRDPGRENPRFLAAAAFSSASMSLSTSARILGVPAARSRLCRQAPASPSALSISASKRSHSAWYASAMRLAKTFALVERGCSWTGDSPAALTLDIISASSLLLA
ncbi:MAG: hypothetical protein K6U03_08425 [Firmicutes bacterium]|nr:hypothetical protein [Bacillota bacterium]